VVSQYHQGDLQHLSSDHVNQIKFMKDKASLTCTKALQHVEKRDITYFRFELFITTLFLYDMSLSHNLSFFAMLS